MRCVICGAEIEKPEYAIRPFVGEESFIQWLLRHIKRLLTLGLYKYRPWYRPVCGNCAVARKISR
jgi:hypothetical protein